MVAPLSAEPPTARRAIWIKEYGPHGQKQQYRDVARPQTGQRVAAAASGEVPALAATASAATAPSRPNAEPERPATLRPLPSCGIQPSRSSGSPWNSPHRAAAQLRQLRQPCAGSSTPPPCRSMRRGSYTPLTNIPPAPTTSESGRQEPFHQLPGHPPGIGNRAAPRVRDRLAVRDLRQDGRRHDPRGGACCLPPITVPSAAVPAARTTPATPRPRT